MLVSALKNVLMWTFLLSVHITDNVFDITKYLLNFIQFLSRTYSYLSNSADFFSASNIVCRFVYVVKSYSSIWPQFDLSGLQHTVIHPVDPFGLPLDFQTLPGQLRQVGKRIIMGVFCFENIIPTDPTLKKVWCELFWSGPRCSRPD